MLKKRVIGVITVKDNWAVQSLGYRRYLPLGRPEILAENLDRWGADEVLLQCIDRSPQHLGPNYELIERVAACGLSTPLIYAGGVRCAAEALRVINVGADRIAIDSLFDTLFDADEKISSANRNIQEISECVGAQALITSMPLSMVDGQLARLNYRSGTVAPLSSSMLALINSKSVSEYLVIDWKNEGKFNGFNVQLIDTFPQGAHSLIAFGGISETHQIEALLACENIGAVAVGNFLNYKEHAINTIKRKFACRYSANSKLRLPAENTTEQYKEAMKR